MLSQIQMEMERAENALFVCLVGEEICRPGHFCGPMRRSYYLIHFVRKGCGYLRCGGQEYEIGSGQGFLILPEEETYYQASQENPWHYAWVGYQGMHAAELTAQGGLDAERRIFTAREPERLWKMMTDMQREARESPLTQVSALGNLLRFISLIAPVQNPLRSGSLARQYCEKAQWYLEGRYDRDVSIQETADFLGLSRSRLYRVMMEEMGCSPKELLSSIRMRHAARLLLTTTQTLEEIAHQVGLQTGQQLAVPFRKAYGQSPSSYRREGSSPPQREER